MSVRGFPVISGTYVFWGSRMGPIYTSSNMITHFHTKRWKQNHCKEENPEVKNYVFHPLNLFHFGQNSGLIGPSGVLMGLTEEFEEYPLGLPASEGLFLHYVFC